MLFLLPAAAAIFSLLYYDDIIKRILFSALYLVPYFVAFAYKYQQLRPNEQEYMVKGMGAVILYFIGANLVCSAAKRRHLAMGLMCAFITGIILITPVRNPRAFYDLGYMFGVLAYAMLLVGPATVVLAILFYVSQRGERKRLAECQESLEQDES